MGSFASWLPRWSSEHRRVDGDTDRPGREAGRFLDVLPWSRRRPQNHVERIVIYRLGSLGDTIVALPCFHKIAEAFPDAERLVLTNIPVSAKAAPLPSILENSGLVHGYITYPVRVRSLRALWNLARELRRLRASTLVYLMIPRGKIAVRRDYLFFRLCGIPRIIGAPLTPDLAERSLDPETGEAEYESKRLARNMAPLGPIDLDDPASWDLNLTADERAVGAKAVAGFEDRPFIAINMGGKFVENHWGSDNWRALFRELASTHGSFGILAVGGPEDAPAVGPVTEGWPGPVVNACGTLAPRETAAALEKAALFIGHDSGPMHLASACGVRCVAMFGRLKPRIWHPYGRRHKIFHNMNGVMATRVEEVAAAVREALAVAPSGSVGAG